MSEAMAVMPPFQNGFGAVYSDRVAFRRKKSWFGGGSLEELPLRHVTSVRFEMTRKLVLGIILIGIGLLSFGSGQGGVIFGGLIIAALGVLLLIGWPTVTINTSGNDLQVMKGTILEKADAEEYVTQVKKALFAKP